MSLAQELAAKELQHQKAEHADHEWVIFRGRTMAAKYPALWGDLTRFMESFAREYNVSLPEPVVTTRPDGVFAFEVTKRGRVSIVARVHLNSSSDCIEFTVSRKIGLESKQFDQGSFACDLGSTGELIVLGLERATPMSVEEVATSIMSRAL
jgi:hypothetical protein